jgi:hypothetical protein
MSQPKPVKTWLELQGLAGRKRDCAETHRPKEALPQVIAMLPSTEVRAMLQRVEVLV